MFFEYEFWHPTAQLVGGIGGGLLGGFAGGGLLSVGTGYLGGGRRNMVWWMDC